MAQGVVELKNIGRKADKYCEVCGKMIKKNNRSWADYDKKKYCCVGCKTLGMRSRRNDAVSAIKLDDGTVLPIGGYIATQSDNGRLIADMYLGALKRVKGINDDADINGVDGNKGIMSRYKGVPLTLEFLKAASDWLTSNWLGKPGQRREVVPEPELNAEEIKASLEALCDEQGLVILTKVEYDGLVGK